MNLRKTESILTLISGIIGVLVSGLALLGGMVLSTVDLDTLPDMEATPEELELVKVFIGSIKVLAGFALVIAIVLIVLSFMIKKNKNTTVYGIIMIILGIVPFFMVSFLWAVSGILAVIAGIMLLTRKVEIPEDPMAF
ncbi:DUF4064 domain-containing protein [Vagococcus hydrophili]|uniref:DUF4064 domain-containing protein n=1 Tax=Vagococcus hydrophili TaxID=2714947 RepID=A0A6G8ASR0_9ENTE|nr:DUF4064 domain-containing protein [Vagococcus hydrophili]QIL48111.1 DUF4064 domain-containing protein [Vagococcus hydrophili]